MVSGLRRAVAAYAATRGSHHGHNAVGSPAGSELTGAVGSQSCDTVASASCTARNAAGLTRRPGLAPRGQWRLVKFRGYFIGVGFRQETLGSETCDWSFGVSCLMSHVSCLTKLSADIFAVGFIIGSLCEPSTPNFLALS